MIFAPDRGMKSYVIVFSGLASCGAVYAQDMKPLTPEERRVIVGKATEPPFTGRYCDFDREGTYLCRRCGAPLYRSQDKFDAGCGWPSFDDEIPGAVRREPDADGRRTEILCARCGGHLGHVFAGEGFTPRNLRHCVNSLSLSFEAASPTGGSGTSGVAEASGPDAAAERPLDTAIFAGGCFWGVEHLLAQVPGVVEAVSGYTGGRTEHPTYREVCDRNTGHVEAVRVKFDPAAVSYETLARIFFEIHDPTQRDGQGPDIGEQYRSVIFYASPEQEATARRLIALLRERGCDVATELRPAVRFWPAEEYHQDYYLRHGTQPYCHRRIARF